MNTNDIEKKQNVATLASVLATAKFYHVLDSAGKQKPGLHVPTATLCLYADRPLKDLKDSDEVCVGIAMLNSGKFDSSYNVYVGRDEFKRSTGRRISAQRVAHLVTSGLGDIEVARVDAEGRPVGTYVVAQRRMKSDVVRLMQALGREKRRAGRGRSRSVIGRWLSEMYIPKAMTAKITVEWADASDNIQLTDEAILEKLNRWKATPQTVQPEKTSLSV